MALKYQIFVSSTYEDLKTERDRVIQGILEMGHIPVGMEMFSAADEDQWPIIARHIEESDYYVVILAHRYGSTVGGVSFTRKEYEYAISKGVPTIGFVIDPSTPWPGDKVDSDPDAITQMSEFRALVEKKPVGYWTSADDLYGKSTVALVKAMTAQPQVGWVRASSALGPEITAEISRLSAENSSLRNKITELEQQNKRDDVAEIMELWSQMRKAEWDFSARFPGEREWADCHPKSYSELFSMLAPNMVVEITVDLVNDILAMNAVHAEDGLEDSDRRRAEMIPINIRNGLLADFMTFGVMEPSTRRHPVSDTNEYWTLTTLGQELLKNRQRAAFAAGLDPHPASHEAPTVDAAEESVEA